MFRDPGIAVATSTPRAERAAARACASAVAGRVQRVLRPQASRIRERTRRENGSAVGVASGGCEPRRPATPRRVAGYLDSVAPALGDTGRPAFACAAPARRRRRARARRRRRRAEYSPARRSGRARRSRRDVVGGRLPVARDDTSYRFLVETPTGPGGSTGPARGDRDVADRDDFVLVDVPRSADWLADAVCYEIFPDRFARGIDERAAGSRDGGLGDRVRLGHTDRSPTGSGPSASSTAATSSACAEHLDHLEPLGVNLIYLTPVFPARSCHRYDASTFDHVDPVLGGDAALATLVDAAHARGIRVVGDLTTNHSGNHHEWFERGPADAPRPRPATTTSPSIPHDYVGWFDVPTLPKFDLRSDGLRRRLVDGAPTRSSRRWLAAARARRLAHRCRQHDRPPRRDRRQPRGVPRHAGDDGRGRARTAGSSASTSTTPPPTSPATAGTA